MPYLNGIEMSSKIRSFEKVNESKNYVTIIGLTGHDSSEIKEGGISSGMNMVICKPSTIHDIKYILTTYIFCD